MSVLLGVGWVAVVAAGGPAVTEARLLSAGAARVDISPTNAVRLMGHSARTALSRATGPARRRRCGLVWPVTDRPAQPPWHTLSRNV